MTGKMAYYHTIDKTAQAEFKERGSRFIAFAFPVTDADGFKKKLQELKKEHPKAVHHCFAYRIGYDGNQFRANDDGEPSGSAGKPILGQIDSKSLTDTAVVVVRYFGGTLLGVPGLIQAYKTAAALALQMIPIVRKPITEDYLLNFEYQILNDIMLLIKSCECIIKKQDSGLFCSWEIAIPLHRKDELLFKLNEIRNVEVSKLLPNSDK
jgi:uncharacterized YigZ family protein